MKYLEMKRFDGKWWPAASTMGIEKERETGDGKFAIRGIREVAPEHEGLTLDQLQEIYGTKD